MDTDCFARICSKRALLDVGAELLPKIRAEVCRLLEGGHEAFEKTLRRQTAMLLVLQRGGERLVAITATAPWRPPGATQPG